MAARTDDLVLEARGIEVRFGGIRANAGVELEVQRGEIAALIGPNGAGKTTLFDVLSGARRPHAGQVRLEGRDVTDVDRRGRARLGMARTFQHIALVDELSVLDNVVVGLGRFRRTGLAGAVVRTPRARAEDRNLRMVAGRVIELVGLAELAAVPVHDLPFGRRRMAELARAVALGPTVLLLDEPSSGMDPTDTDDLVQVVGRLRDECGITVLVVEHDMTVVRRLADRTTVLDFGAVLTSGSTATVLSDPRVVAAYLGQDAGVA
jgi:branched-chain amino acid transport system ATP-binding protein